VCFTDFGMLNLVKFCDGSLVLGPGQFLLLLYLPQKLKLDTKMVKIDTNHNHFATLI
jgi:hypothetical protein